jgi:hypothetical protein
VIAPSISTGTFGVAPQDAGVASATVNVGQQLGASIGTSLLNTLFTAAVTSYLVAHVASARLIGRQALTGLALAHGYDTAFWWIAGIFAGGAIICGALLRNGPLIRTGAPAQAARGVRPTPRRGRPYSSDVMRPAFLRSPPYALRTEGASRPRARARSTASWRLWTPSLAYRWRRWVLTVFTERNSSLAISCTVRWVGR